jgi:hypothetical protein
VNIDRAETNARELILFADGVEEAGLRVYAQRARVVADDLLKIARTNCDPERSVRQSIQKERDRLRDILSSRGCGMSSYALDEVRSSSAACRAGRRTGRRGDALGCPHTSRRSAARTSRTSAEKRSWQDTQPLRVLDLLVQRTVNISDAALFRVVARRSPSL